MSEALRARAADRGAGARSRQMPSDVLYLGRGTAYPIALEGALKLKEISYIHAEGYAAGELKHGPIALIDETMPVVVIAPFDKSAARRVREDRVEHAGGGGARRQDHPDHRSEGRAPKRRALSLSTLTLPDMADDGDAAGLCHPGAAHRLSHRGEHGHRRRPAAQSREVGDGRVSAETMTLERPERRSAAAAEPRRRSTASPAGCAIISSPA